MTPLEKAAHEYGLIRMRLVAKFRAMVEAGGVGVCNESMNQGKSVTISLSAKWRNMKLKSASRLLDSSAKARVLYILSFRIERI